MRKSFRTMAAIGASLMFGTTGCTLKATINQTTDTTSNITGTTSGAAWWSEDGQIKPDFKTTAFVSFNHENLRQNLAAGRGEYLVSMSTLLGIPEDRQPAFFSAAQASYTQMADRDSTALLALLKDTSRLFVR
ncbi:MAG: DUF3015 family protein [Nitrospira sp.]|nr:MAG: DUF3015 domain-containing protein [Nitrospira sp.]